MTVVAKDSELTTLDRQVSVVAFLAILSRIVAESKNDALLGRWTRNN